MANMKIGDLFYKITGDTKGLDKSIKKTDTEMKGFGKSISNVGKLIKGAVFTGALIAGAKGLFNLSKELIKVSSDAQETANKFNVVFADVADDAQEAADRIKDEFKLSDSSTEKFLSQVGDITSGLGATSSEALNAADQITRLGLDINSFANLSGGAEQAVSALTSLFTGEREAAKALGIVINDTNLKQYAEDTGKVFKELTPLEKGFLSLELATKQSELAIGDFARSSDSYANTAKAAEEATIDFKAAIGESLLPAATASLGIFTSLTTKLTEYVKEHNELRTLLDKFENDTDTAQDRLDLAEREIAVTQKLYDDNLELLKLKQGTAQNLREQEYIESLFDTSSALNTKLRAQQKILEAIRLEAEAEKAVADEIKAKEDAANRLATVQLELSSTLEERRRAALSDEEKALDNLQKQIDYWVQFREIAGVQALINDLIRERNELQKEEETGLRDVSDLEETLAEGRISRHEARLEEIGEFYEEQERLRLKDLADEEAAQKRKIELAFEYSNAAIGFLRALDSFSSATSDAELQRLKESGASEEELEAKKKEIAIEQAKRKKALGLLSVGINTASAIIGFLADPGGIHGTILSIIAGATGAIQAGAIAATPIPSFANGGIVPGTSYSGDNVAANVNSSEMILNKSQQAKLFDMANGGGGGNQPVYLIVDGEQFTAHFQKKINNRGLYSSKGGAL